MRQLWRVVVALWVCWRGHRGQVDKGGVAYLRHPLRVALLAWAICGELEAVVVGLLHDYIEDVNYEHGWMDIHRHFGAGIASQVWSLTRRRQMCDPRVEMGFYRRRVVRDETYAEYIERVVREGDRVVLAVKMADLLHNTDPARKVPREFQMRVAFVTKSGDEIDHSGRSVPALPQLRRELYLQALGQVAAARAYRTQGVDSSS